MIRLATTLLLAVTLTAPRPARAAEELLVFAAASLGTVLQDLALRFEKTTSDRISFHFGASSDLARQLVYGAPADVFFSADTAQVQRLEGTGVLARSDRRELLSNVLVVVVPKDATTTVSTPADLASLKRVALADPEAVPAGVYARQWLEKAGVWDRVRPQVIPTLDVRAALAAVATGNADAAVVYRTDAAIEPRVRVAFTVQPADGPRIVYVLVPVKASTKPGTRTFVDFLTSAEARGVFQAAGFIVTP